MHNTAVTRQPGRTTSSASLTAAGAGLKPSQWLSWHRLSLHPHVTHRGAHKSSADCSGWDPL